MENIDDDYKACGPLYVAQWALRMYSEDETNNASDRFDSFVTFAWIGELEATIDELVQISQWAGQFALDALKKYENRVPTELLENYGNAVESLEYQLQHYQ